MFQVLYNLNDGNELRQGYNPRLIIRAVNVLWPLGKEKALAAVAEYVRVSNEDTDFHAWESLILFCEPCSRSRPSRPPSVTTTMTKRSRTSRNHEAPSVLDDAVHAKIAAAPANCDRGGIPFFLPRGVGSTGPGPEPLLHVAYFRKYGTLRARPLAPTNKPIAAVERLIDSPPLRTRQMGQDHEMGEVERDLYNQALRLLDTVDRLEPNDDMEYLKYCCCADTKEKEGLGGENRKSWTKRRSWPSVGMPRNPFTPGWTERSSRPSTKHFIRL